MKARGLWILIAFYLFFALDAYATSTSAPHFIYEIFTQSFSDSNGDGIGDLNGVRSKLDYISSLGADAIWLTPIFESPSYHGYDVSDYFNIKDCYGNLDDLKQLISDAHAKNIKIILDVPVNHTSDQHPWFAERDLYLWSGAPSFLPEQWYPKDGNYYFSSFSSDMPDLNWKNPKVLTQVESIFQYWTSIGIDGFRLDAAKYLIKGKQGQQNMAETHSLWQQIVAFVKKSAPQTYFIGEVWDTAQNIAPYYGTGNELDAAFDFPVEGSIRSSITSMQNTDLVNALTTGLSVEKNPFFAAPFAGSHDLDRLSSVLNLDEASEKLAALSVFSLPGTPTVYYGDEIGMPSGDLSSFPGDLAKRTPMDWDSEGIQENDSESVLNTYRTLASLRKNHPALDAGTLSQINAIGTGALSFVRTDTQSAETVMVVINFSPRALTSKTIKLKGSFGDSAQVIYGTATIDSSHNSISILNLGPKQGVILSIDTP
jgi:alpha-amylase